MAAHVVAAVSTAGDLKRVVLPGQTACFCGRVTGTVSNVLRQEYRGSEHGCPARPDRFVQEGLHPFSAHASGEEPGYRAPPRQAHRPACRAGYTVIYTVPEGL